MASPRDQRLAEFLRRLAEAPAAASFDEAYRLLCSTLDGVEDELSGLPNDPGQWMTLERMFPPQRDRMSSIAGCDVQRFDSKRHITYIAANGALEIRGKRRPRESVVVLCSKAGADGRRLSDVCPPLAAANL